MGHSSVEEVRLRKYNNTQLQELTSNSASCIDHRLKWAEVVDGDRKHCPLNAIYYMVESKLS